MIIFRFDGKTQLQMFLLLYGWSTNTIQSSLNFGETVFSNNAGMNNRTVLNLGEVVYISIIFHIPAS